MLKYLKLIALFKDVSTIYEEEQGKEKPWYVSRRFFGSIVILLSGILYTLLNITIESKTATDIAEQTTNIAKAIRELIPSVLALYGAVQTIVGQARRKKSENK